MAENTPVEDLIDSCTRACTVLRSRYDEWCSLGLEADAQLLLNIAKRLEADIQTVTAAVADVTPPTGTYIERLFDGLRNDSELVPIVLKWLRRRMAESSVLLHKAIPVAELVGDYDMADAMRRWLERVEEGPDTFTPHQ